MSTRTRPEEEATRYAWLIRRVMERIQKEMPSDLDAERLWESGQAGLVRALSSHRTRQGTTRRHDAWYGVFNAVVEELQKRRWESAGQIATLSFWQKANLLMAFYGNSAEGMMKRDTKAVISELRNLLRFLILICWMSFDATLRRDGFQTTEPVSGSGSSRKLQESMARLSESERLFIGQYYASQPTDAAASGSRTKKNVSRMHWRILDTLARSLVLPKGTAPPVERDVDLKLG